MPRQCSTYGCSNSKDKDSGISLHRFPIKDKENLRKWLDQVKREDFVPTEASFLCSEHFTEDDFQYQNFTGRRQIKRGAVPSKFCHVTMPSPAKKRKRSTFGSETHKNDENIMLPGSEEEIVSSKRELQEDDLKQKLKLKDEEIKNFIKEKEMEIDSLQNKIISLEMDFSLVNLQDDDVKSLTGFSKERFFLYFQFLYTVQEFVFVP